MVERSMSNKNFIYLAVIIALTSIGSPTNAMAQEALEIRFDGWGIRLGLSSDPDQVYGGIHFNLGEFTKDVRFRPTVELGFGDNQTVLHMLTEVHYVFSKPRAWKPYLGGGLGLTYVNFYNDHSGDTSDIEASLNWIGGVETELNKGKRFFFEFKLGLSHDDPDIKFGVGLSWH
jgi:opacity protein-like surface antigen